MILDEVYFVTSVDDDTVLLGIAVTIEHNRVSWFDTIRERLRVGAEVNELPGGVLRIIDLQRRTYVFTPLTLELYNSRVRDQLDGVPGFRTQARMKEFFQEMVAGVNQAVG